MYHGWADQDIAPQASINFYTSTIHATKPPAQSPEWLRLFMVPGMQHCGGGPGPDVFGQLGFSSSNDPQHNMYLALEQWVEKGVAPTTVIATKQPVEGSAVKVTRPLCAYPQVAKYKGSGDTNDAANFVCGAPPAK
jgi:feruloyl esterase